MPLNRAILPGTPWAASPSDPAHCQHLQTWPAGIRIDFDRSRARLYRSLHQCQSPSLPFRPAMMPLPCNQEEWQHYCRRSQLRPESRIVIIWFTNRTLLYTHFHIHDHPPITLLVLTTGICNEHIVLFANTSTYIQLIWAITSSHCPSDGVIWGRPFLIQRGLKIHIDVAFSDGSSIGIEVNFYTMLSAVVKNKANLFSTAGPPSSWKQMGITTSFPAWITTLSLAQNAESTEYAKLNRAPLHRIQCKICYHGQMIWSRPGISSEQILIL